MKKLGKEVEDGTRRLKYEIAVAIVNRLAEATPVDTGKARSNWMVGVGVAPGGTRLPFSPIPSRWRAPYRGGGSRGERRNLLGVTSAAQGALKSFKGDETLYIANNLPYIERLNEGYSKQSSAGFVRAAFNAGRTIGAKNARFKL